MLSTNNKLKALSFNGLSMTPDFNPEVLEYKVNVDYKTEVLYFSYVPGHGKQKVRLKDNSGLVPGENTVKVVVSSESGDKRVYKIQVVKETEEQIQNVGEAAESSGEAMETVKDGAGGMGGGGISGGLSLAPEGSVWSFLSKSGTGKMFMETADALKASLAA